MLKNQAHNVGNNTRRNEALNNDFYIDMNGCSNNGNNDGNDDVNNEESENEEKDVITAFTRKLERVKMLEQANSKRWENSNWKPHSSKM